MQISAFPGFVLAAVAGMSFVAQQAVNARFRTQAGSPWWAGFVSYAGGTLVMALLIVLLRERTPTSSTLAHLPWWAWTGGALGAVYIAISILLVPRLGTATVVALFVFGQMVASLLFDQCGAFGVPRIPIDAPRVIGATLLLLGVILVQRA